MGKPTGFLEIERKTRSNQTTSDRVQHFGEFSISLPDHEVSSQGARCMDCGTPFCHKGCPVDNIIPDWNDLVYRNKWREALDVLHSTNNFPEFTGRICPAPCEAACTLNLQDQPVSIKTIEHSLVEKGWEEGWVLPQIPRHRTGNSVAVVGSGPAGLAAAQQLARAGHRVDVYEKNERIGGLLRYGIPDFKLDKRVIDRRMGQMQAEGVRFFPSTHIGVDSPVKLLHENYDAVILSGGSEKPRDLPVPGRDLKGIHFAMEFLSQQNRRLAGVRVPEEEEILATGRRVVVIGGGDTGSDCVGTSVRQGARWVTQIEIALRPPKMEDKALTWPEWPHKLRTSTSHEEGCQRKWVIATKSFEGKNGRLTKLNCVRVGWTEGADGRMVMEEIPGSDFQIRADLVLLGMGFVHPVYEGMLEQLGVDMDPRGNVQAEFGKYMTSIDKVFTAGDMRRGQSLVVWAIREGRGCARAVDAYLTGSSALAGYPES